MKAICFSACLVFFTASAIAQTNFLNRPVSPGLENNYLVNKNKQPIRKYTGLTAYGTKILPQDNMPCLVPDISLIAVMPVVKNMVPNQYIPNPLLNTPAK